MKKFLLFFVTVSLFAQGDSQLNNLAIHENITIHSPAGVAFQSTDGSITSHTFQHRAQNITDLKNSSGIVIWSFQDLISPGSTHFGHHLTPLVDSTQNFGAPGIRLLHGYFDEITVATQTVETELISNTLISA
jgi:hypothetical protein